MQKHGENTKSTKSTTPWERYVGRFSTSHAWKWGSVVVSMQVKSYLHVRSPSAMKRSYLIGLDVFSIHIECSMQRKARVSLIATEPHLVPAYPEIRHGEHVNVVRAGAGRGSMKGHCMWHRIYGVARHCLTTSTVISPRS